jgi:hypothetical protein
MVLSESAILMLMPSEIAVPCCHPCLMMDLASKQYREGELQVHCQKATVKQESRVIALFQNNDEHKLAHEALKEIMTTVTYELTYHLSGRASAKTSSRLMGVAVARIVQVI